MLYNFLYSFYLLNVITCYEISFKTFMIMCFIVCSEISNKSLKILVYFLIKALQEYSCCKNQQTICQYNIYLNANKYICINLTLFKKLINMDFYTDIGKIRKKRLTIFFLCFQKFWIFNKYYVINPTLICKFDKYIVYIF